MWEEIRSDYYNEEMQGYSIDGWRHGKEEGEVIAWVFTDKVVFIDNASRSDQDVLSHIEECQQKIWKQDKFKELVHLLTIHHQVPTEVKYDVLKRASDWISSNNQRDHDYLQHQINYLMRFVNR